MKLFQSDQSRNLGILALRLSAALMLLHGWKKLSNFSELSEKFADPIGLGPSISLSLTVFAEVFCTVFIVIGLFTRMATIPAMICMAVAAFITHSGDDLSKKEAALGYLLLYVAIFFLGAGRYSADNYLRRNAKW